MTARKRKKNSRQRGSHTHGWGSKKKHRGAGNRGGRGRAGSGKKGDAKKPSNIFSGYQPGKRGFKKKNIKINVKAISLKYLQEHIDKFLKQKLINKEGDTYLIELKKLGFNKLLSGKVKYKLRVKTPFASKSSIEKIKAAGGEVIFPKETHKTESPKARRKKEISTGEISGEVTKVVE